jgi:hypothetical protein
MGLSWLTGTLGLAASTFIGKAVGSWASKKIEERRWAKQYKLAGETKKDAPPPAVFAPVAVPTVTLEQQELERLRIRTLQVTLGAEVTLANDAVHQIRNLLDDARTEIAKKTADIVVLRQQLENLQKKYDELLRASEKLRAENKWLREEGESNVSRDDQHAQRPDGRHRDGRLTNPGLPPPPRIPGFGKGPKPSGER